MSDTLIVGSFTLGGAIVGAAVGFLSGYLLDQRRSARERRAAVRLLRTELTTNVVVADALREGKAIRQFQEREWQSAKFQLALTLPGDLFTNIAHAYFMFQYHQSIMDRARNGQPLDRDDLSIIGKWRHQLDDLSRSLMPFE